MKHYRLNNDYKGGLEDNIIPPNGWVEVTPPEHADQKWNGTDWDALPNDHINVKREQAKAILKNKKPVYTPQESKARFDAIEEILGI